MFSGGQGVYVSNLSRELNALGHDIHVISGPPYPELAESVTLHKVRNYNYHRLLATNRRFFYGRDPLDAFGLLNLAELVTTRVGMYSVMGAFSIRAYDRFHRLHAEQPFDVVHDNQVLGYGTLLIKLFGPRVVATVHHPLDADRANRIREGRSLGEQVRAALFYPFFMQKIVAQRVDQVVAVSPKGRRDVARSFDLPLERVALVRNGVDTETFKKKADVERRDARILFVGDTEDRNKGFEYLLMAVHMLDPLVPAEVVVVQRSWSRKALILAREFGLEGRVTFVDSLTVDELVGEYNRATMLVSPSLYEGFGLPAAEAQACGTPVIATTAGAFAEIVDDETGRIVPPGDAAALAEAIRELLLDDDLRESMGRAAELRIRERFSWRRAAEMMDAIYRGEPQRTECMMVAS